MSQPRKATNSPAAAAKKVIFNAPAVASRLEALRAAVVEKDGEEAQWWKAALDIAWGATRKGNNGTQWVSVTYTDENGIAGRLVTRINGERHTGQIMPNTEEGVAELAARVKNPNVKVEKRTKKPAVQIQKWAAQVKTTEDGVTLLTDGEDRPILPEDDKRSAYFRVAACVNEAFAAEAKERVERGLALLAKAAELKRKDKTTSAQAVADAFAAEQGSRRPGDVIFSSETVAAIRKLFPSARDTELLTKGAIVTTNTKIANLVQEYISDQAKRNAGLPLPNPMTRISMNFDQTTGIAQMSFFDKDQPYVEDGRQKFDTGKVDGDPVNADNVHKFVLSRSTLDGIVNMDSVCFSNMGISMPVKTEVLVVARPASREVTLDDVYDDEGFNAGGYSSADALGGGAGEPEASRASAPAKPAAKATPVAKTAPAEEDYDSLLGELAGDPVAGRGGNQ